MPNSTAPSNLQERLEGDNGHQHRAMEIDSATPVQTGHAFPAVPELRLLEQALAEPEEKAHRAENAAYFVRAQSGEQLIIAQTEGIRLIEALKQAEMVLASMEADKQQRIAEPERSGAIRAEQFVEHKNSVGHRF